MQPELFLPTEQLVSMGEAKIITNEDSLCEVVDLMHDERLSQGGNIRDKSMSDVEEFIASGGHVWSWVEHGRIVSACTIEPFVGDHPWWYLNNGVTRKHARGQGIAGRLIGTVVQNYEQSNVGFITIYVRQNLYERLGFTEVSVDQLTAIDEKIASVIRGKLRHGKESHIFLRTPNQSLGELSPL